MWLWPIPALTPIASGLGRLAVALPYHGPDTEAFYILVKNLGSQPARLTVHLKKAAAIATPASTDYALDRRRDAADPSRCYALTACGRSFLGNTRLSSAVKRGSPRRLSNLGSTRQSEQQLAIFHDTRVPVPEKPDRDRPARPSARP